jgi:hypothetical protein
LQCNPFPGTLYCTRRYKRQLGAGSAARTPKAWQEQFRFASTLVRRDRMSLPRVQTLRGKRVEVDLVGTLLGSGGRSLFRRERFPDTNELRTFFLDFFLY